MHERFVDLSVSTSPRGGPSTLYFFSWPVAYGTLASMLMPSVETKAEASIAAPSFLNFLPLRWLFVVAVGVFPEKYVILDLPCVRTALGLSINWVKTEIL